MILPTHPFRSPVPDSSVRSVQRVVRFDGRTRVLAGRSPGGAWFRARHRTRLTREVAEALRAQGISEVVLRRGRHRASFPLGWMSRREE